VNAGFLKHQQQDSGVWGLVEGSLGNGFISSFMVGKPNNRSPRHWKESPAFLGGSFKDFSFFTPTWGNDPI